MNRIFILRAGDREERGLVSVAELLDAIWLFFHECRKRGVKAVYLDGAFIAEKDGVMLTLTIGETCESIPSRMLEDVLEDFLTRSFGE